MQSAECKIQNEWIFAGEKCRARGAREILPVKTTFPQIAQIFADFFFWHSALCILNSAFGWRGGGAVERTTLLTWMAQVGHEGSNPSLSASGSLFATEAQRHRGRW